LQTKRQVLLFSSTFVAEGEDPGERSIFDSEFFKAIHPKTIGAGFSMCVVLYTILNFFGLPIMLIYGIVRGFGDLPHHMALEIVGAMLARFYLRKRFGTKNFLRAAPTLMAGYMTGVGLIGMATIALKLIQTAVSSAPF
jgi:hypothetical protein